ncbi:MAG: glucoamylase family protein [Mobilitalea sp.]
MTQGINFYINTPIRIVVLIILLTLIICILIFLYHRFNHFTRKVRFPINSLGSDGGIGPKDWEKHMVILASEHKQVSLFSYSFVLDDYNQIAYKKLNKIRDNISEISADIISLIPAARWLFDNFQMMYREIKKVRSSGNSYEILPILKSKEYRGFPRVYIVAKRMVALSGGHLSEENISVMLKAYQKEIPLTDKELWVLPEMLGFCLLESIIEVAEEIIQMVDIKAKAENFIRTKLKSQNGTTDITALLTELEPEVRNNYSFHAHVVYLLKNMSFDEGIIQRYMEYHFDAKSKMFKSSHLFLEEGKIESILETKIRAFIVSLRDINEFDEERFYSQYSCLEQILSQDPEGIYEKMDSEARGLYRGAIVKLSLKYRISEEKLAKDCLELAISGHKDLHRDHHVGTYLLGSGYPLLKAKALGREMPRTIKKTRNKKGFFYFLCFGILYLLLNLCLIYMIQKAGNITNLSTIIILLIAAVPLLMGISLELNNFLFTRNIAVKKLPSLDYVREIPNTARTFVIMPVIVSSKDQGLTYMERLQKHYLANMQNNLYFALLVDFEDSPDQFIPKDEIIQNALVTKMKELNELYPSDSQRFSLFFRYRKWNKAENCYMGWERKRGKLEEFNNLLNGLSKEQTSFSTILTDEALLDTFQYVITLDADTNLLRDNAAKLVGIIDHPLNRPMLDLEGSKVMEGYVIIQPSVRNHIVPKSGSRFAEIFGGESGLANYSAVISDIYQDIFDQGIYTGKGIYDVKAFHKLLHNTIPENRVLSHDLLESCYARTAFSSTAKIMDTFPTSVLSFAKREHRWIRGDWQLLPWLFWSRKVHGKTLCPLAKWKIFDNLRRSLVPISKILFILLNLAYFPSVFYLWIPLIFFNDAFTFFVLLISILKQKLFRPKLVLVYKSFLMELCTIVERAYVEFAITPYRAYIAADAMIRTLYRLLISKKNLLRWNTAESVDASIINTRRGYFLTMYSSLIPAVIIAGILMVREIPPIAILIYIIVMLVWVMAYHLAYNLSQPKNLGAKEDNEDAELLLDTARRTWQFFKAYSTRSNNWLCPDNVQLAATEKESDKTSPTNIGLQVLSILSARDFGFETLSSTINRLELLMDTIQRLDKWKGHLYNWYDIRTLEVLNPAYISTVDSGNYLGHLIALKNGLLEQLKKPIIPHNLVEELRYAIKESNKELVRGNKQNQCDCHKLQDDYDTLGEFVEDITDIWDDLSGKDIKRTENSCSCNELLGKVEGIVSEIADFKLKELSFASYPTLNKLAEDDNKYARNMVNRIKTLCNRIDYIHANVDFSFLFNEKRMLFHIGYHVSNHVLDGGCYDLLASESALTSLLAIARNDVPLKHWFKLGRPMTMVNGNPCFVSWSGTMFEYLMPKLVFKEYEGSVYEETAKAAVLQQMIYAEEANIPWGISESQYYRFDLNSNYQYKAFGVPKISLQPVRKTSMVVTPYATVLALEYAEEEGIKNLKRLMDEGMYGDYGFYEAIDFNLPNAAEMTPYCIVRSYMAHHQGMILVAINNYLHHGIMRERFHSEAMIRATEVLLEERRQSHLISIAKRGYTIKSGKPLFKEDSYSNRYINSVAPEIPVANYLNNNRYSVMITSDGDGFSKFGDMMLYRWRADLYANTGNYIYIMDKQKSKLWSTAYQPTKTEPDEYQVLFTPHQAEFKRRDGDISTRTIVSLDPDHHIELRKVSITNSSNQDRTFELTSYLEVVGDTHMAELSHPAFNKLFVESEYLTEQDIFLSKRRSKKESSYPYVLQMIRSATPLTRKIEYENDRKRFIGRNHTLQHPEAVAGSISFSNQSGFCNDPIMSMRAQVAVKAGETACITFVTGICETKEEAVKIGEELSVAYRIDDIFEKFRLQKDIELKYLEITRAQMNAFQNLISPIFYPARKYRGPVENIRRNFQNQSFLWKFGVSGDNPILLLKVQSIEEAGVIREVLKAYEYLRINHVMVDLVILIDAKHGYLQEVDDLINDMTSSLRIHDGADEKRSFFMIHTYQMIPAEIDLLFTVARIVFSDKTGIYFRNLKEHLNEFYVEE